MSKTRRRRSTIDCRCSKLIDWLTFRTKRSTLDCHFRRLTIILADSRCVKWKWDAIIVFKEKTFVSWRFVLLFHSRRFVLLFRDFFRKNFRFVKFEDALCKFFIQLTKIRSVVSWSLSKRTSHFDDLILLIRVSRRAIHYLSKQNVWSSVS